MSLDPNSTSTITSILFNPFYSMLFGALLAISAGAIIKRLEIKIEKGEELNCIKIRISDELEEISEIIEKLSETWEKTKILPKAYIDDLDNNTDAYNDHRSRLFLFKDSDLRRSINAFYKELKKSIQESEGRVGSLADDLETRNEQERIKNKFCTIATNAQVIKEKIDNLSKK